MGLTAAAEWIIGQLLTRGSLTNVTLASNASQILDVDCAGDSELTVMADMTGTANADLAVSVQAFESDNVTPLGLGMPAIRSTGPAFDGVTKVVFDGTYDVSGVSKVRITAQNKNAAQQTLNRLSWRLS